MIDLKHMFESMGLKMIQTYIQSGNVLFISDKDEVYLRKMIQREILIIFGFVVPVVLRTSTELNQIISNCPFSKDKIMEAELPLVNESLFLSFLKEIPSLDKVETLNQYIDEGDEFKIIGRDIFLLFPHHRIRDSKLIRNMHNIDINATVRNWKTINKLNLLAQEMEKDMNFIDE